LPGGANPRAAGILAHIIDEVDPENWGFAGMLTTEYRKQAE
jgi:phenylpyruvate tautomerase PptA (4-oxalocrotonate tautomerase family)